MVMIEIDVDKSPYAIWLKVEILNNLWESINNENQI